MPYYTKKPIPIEARQFLLTPENWSELTAWSKEAISVELTKDLQGVTFVVNTLEGPMRAVPGDYLIKGIKGEFYSCKKEIFEESYTEI